MKKKLLTLFIVAIILSLSLTLVACNEPDDMTIRLSTTTSVNDSGLMDYLMPYFKADTGYKVEINSAGTGAAINAARYGNADVILVHSKGAEEEFVGQGFGLKLRKRERERLSFMHNYFVLVGPEADPAGVESAESIKAAFSLIAAGEHKFVSRGDASGTHNKEITLWPEALGVPDKTKNEKISELGDWYISTGSGMGACLTMAKEENAYVLTDKATFLSYKNDKDGDKLEGLVILYEQDNDLKNTYTIIAVDPDAPFADAGGKQLRKRDRKRLQSRINTKGAEAFADWMLSDRAGELIGQYGVAEYGEALFTFKIEN